MKQDLKSNEMREFEGGKERLRMKVKVEDLRISMRIA